MNNINVQLVQLSRIEGHDGSQNYPEKPEASRSIDLNVLGYYSIIKPRTINTHN